MLLADLYFAATSYQADLLDNLMSRWLFDSMTVPRSLHSLRSYFFCIICNSVRYFSQFDK